MERVEQRRLQPVQLALQVHIRSIPSLMNVALFESRVIDRDQEPDKRTCVYLYVYIRLHT